MAIPLPPDPYKALGVEPTAPEGDIRKVYLKLVLKCHPDKIQDPTLRAQKVDEFHKIQEAWDILGDKTKREDYDEKVKINARNATMRANAPPPRQTRSGGYPSPSPAGYNVYEFQETSNANIYTAEPRDRDSRRRREPSPVRVYAQHSSKTRSYDDDIPSHYYDEEPRMSKSASAAYSGRKPAGATMERERERDRKKADDDRERDRYEKDRKKKEYASSQKTRDREKRSRTEEKTGRKAFVDESPEEYDSRDRDDRRRKDRSDRGDALLKEFDQMHITSKYKPGNKEKEDVAMQYISRAKSKGVPVVPSAPSAVKEEFRPRGGMQRAETFSTYPVPPSSRPYYEDDDVVRRSSASRPSSRRPSADAASPRSSDPNSPHIVDAGIPPFARGKPPLQHHNSAPPVFMDRMPTRAATMDEPSSRRSSGGRTVPSMPDRAATFNNGSKYSGTVPSPLKHSHRAAHYSDVSDSSESDAEPYSSRSRPTPVKRPSVQKVYKIGTKGGRTVTTVVEEDERRVPQGEPVFMRKRSSSPRGASDRPPASSRTTSGMRPKLSTQSSSRHYDEPPRSTPRREVPGNSKTGAGSYFGEVPGNPKGSTTYGYENVKYADYGQPQFSNTQYSTRGSGDIPSHAYYVPRRETVN